MEYARAVWKEGPRVMEDTILRKWIKNNFVYWPVGISAMRALREKKRSNGRLEKCSSFLK